MKKTCQFSDQSGVALVTTIIVVAVLAVVAVAFMQSVGTDRLSSRTGANYMKARLAAEAGASAAEAALANLITQYPDSVTVWQNIGGGDVDGKENEATVLYFRDGSPGDAGVVAQGQPLVSGGLSDGNGEVAPLAPEAIVSAMEFDPSSDLMVDLNATTLSRTNGFVGTRSEENGGELVTAAQWIYLGAEPGPTNTMNPAIARYAYWVEDESFKVNVNVADHGPRDPTSLGLGPEEIRLEGSWDTAKSTDLAGKDAASVVTARTTLGSFPSVATAALPGGVTDVPAMEFLTTTDSAGLDISREGFKRFPINSVTNGVTEGDTASKREALDRIITVITNTNAAPDFGKRFYEGATDPHQKIYLQKIAANIYDYIDEDDQPTVISNNAAFDLMTDRPTTAIEPQGGGTSGENPVAAMGVENLPRLQEYAVHARIVTMNPIGKRTIGGTAGVPDRYFYYQGVAPYDEVEVLSGDKLPRQAQFEVYFDHYFEFWNPGTRDITLTNNAYLKIVDQPGYGEGAIPPGRDSAEIPLIDVLTGDPITFPAGKITVLTTADPLMINSDNGQGTAALISSANLGNVFSLPVEDEDRKFTGMTSATNERNSLYSTAGGSSADNGWSQVPKDLFDLKLDARSSGMTDYETGVILGNDFGYLESFIGLPLWVSGQATPLPLFIKDSVDLQIMEDAQSKNWSAGNQRMLSGGSLRGNSSTLGPSSSEGDPRALNEQLEFQIYTSGGSTDQTRFYGSGLGGENSRPPQDSTIGAPNANYVRPTNWVDYSSTDPGAATAPLVVANTNMVSIGELGHITDPARVAGAGGIELSRGGGRTLRVGQAEHPDWFDGQVASEQRARTSWRLADVFTARTNQVSAPVDLSIPGQINPNGVLRDGGAALEAAWHDFEYSAAGPEGDPRLGGKTLANTARKTEVPATMTLAPAS
jgi:hypothetical protein